LHPVQSVGIDSGIVLVLAGRLSLLCSQNRAGSRNIAVKLFCQSALYLLQLHYHGHCAV